MSRHYLKSWQDRRPAWTRRVRWYQGSRIHVDGMTGPITEVDDIRLEFIDEFGRWNEFFGHREDAQRRYDLFMAGDLNMLNASEGVN
jgi:hypothetical protein